MKAGNAKIGGVYCSPKGALITVAGFRDRKVALLIHDTKMEVMVSKSYPLRQGDALPQPLERLRQPPSQDRVTPSVKKNVPPLSQFIDPLLLEGEMSVRSIVDVIRIQLGNNIARRDLGANVRARIFHLKRRGLLAKNSAH